MAHSYIAATHAFHRSNMALPPRIADDNLLNASLLVVYRVATCEDGGRCRGGDHILEALTGRAYNLAVSAILLCSAGLYDEALNSIRSIGEIANLFGFLRLYPDRYPEWVLADRKKRLREFSPAKIRREIEAKGSFVSPMDADAYVKLCEIATHVHGATAPNPYSPDGRRHVGGFRQEAGIDEVASQLTYVMSMLGMLAANMVGRNDLADIVIDEVRASDGELQADSEESK